jgi:hypothetical protein
MGDNAEKEKKKKKISLTSSEILSFTNFTQDDKLSIDNSKPITQKRAFCN